ncbi:MAG: hypothetical protein ACP5PT_08025 [Brevinematia bacterium]
MRSIFEVVLIVFFIVVSFSSYCNTNVITTNQSKSIDKVLEEMEKLKFETNFFIHGTNIIYPIEYSELSSLKVSFDVDRSFEADEKPFFMDYARRYEIILLVSIPTAYMFTKFLMEQVSFYNYRDYSKNLNTQQWAYVIASSIIIPLIISTEDYIKYKKFVEENLK